MLNRIKPIFYREPDFIIGKPGSPYLRRWYVIPRNRFFNIYLHNMVRSDDDRALHDHPWWNLSVVLRGGYYEFMPQYRPLYPDIAIDVMTSNPQRKWRGVGSLVLRRPADSHRLELPPWKGRTSWSLFITGPKLREWGFWCPRGWKVWTSFVDMTDTGKIGPGCE